MSEEIYKKRFLREKNARLQAEQLLEEKSLELYLKNKELERLNIELNESLSKTSDRLDTLSYEHAQLFENSAVGVVLSKDGKIIQCNSTFSNLIGYTEDEVKGMSVSDLTYKDDVRPSGIETEKAESRKIRKFSIQKRYKKKNGAIFWGSTHVSEITDKSNTYRYLLAVIIDIHKEKITEKKLQQTVTELIEVNDNLESFAHIASHDLKAPLTGINTVLGWMEQNTDPAKSAEYVQIMQNRVIKMHTLIEDIIAYSRVSSTDAERTFFNTKSLIEDTIQLLDIPLHVSIELKGVFPDVMTNKAKLTQVFSNLMDNAIRHIDKEKGAITIEGKEDEKFYYFSVLDNGMGIESKYYSKIFQIFNSLTPTQKSTGIGLSLVKKIVEQLGGKVSVDSKVTEYTRFEFSLAKEKVQL